MTYRIDRAARFIAARPETVFAAWTDADAQARRLTHDGAILSMERVLPEPDGDLVFAPTFGAATDGQCKTDARTDRVEPKARLQGLEASLSNLSRCIERT